MTEVNPGVAPAPETTPEESRLIGTELRHQLDSLAADISEEITADLPEPDDDSVSGPMYDSVKVAIDLFAVLLVEHRELADGPPPLAMAEFARILARRRVPLSTLMILYHRSHNSVERRLLEIVSTLFAERPTSDLLRILTGLRGWSNRFILHVEDAVADVYHSEADRLLSPGDADQLAQVQMVLDGEEAPPEINGHRLAAEQTAVIIQTLQEGVSTATLSTEGRHLAESLGAVSSPLIVHPDPTTAWMWLIRKPLSDQSDASGKGETGHKAVPSPGHSGATVAFVGPPCAGPEGFRRSHRQAQAYLRLHRVIDGTPGLWMGDAPGIGAVAAFADDIDAARDMVAITLGPLAGDDEYSDVLRETARSVLLRGTTGAAGEMIAHRNTVTYRVNKFRETLGDNALHSPDIHLALELTHWYGDKVLTSSADE